MQIKTWDSVPSSPGAVRPFWGLYLLMTFDPVRAVGTICFLRTIDTIRPIAGGPVLTIGPVAPGVVPFFPIASISTVSAIAVPGAAAIFTEQPVAFLTSADLFAQLLQAGAALLEIRPAAFDFPAKIQEF